MKKFKVLSVMALEVAICFIVILLASFAFAASPSTLKRNVWDAKNTFNQEVEFDGNVEFDSTVDFGDATVTGTGKISATVIADVIREYSFDIGAAMVDGTGPILSSTAPNLATLDNVQAVLYDDSSETTGVQWTFKLPATYVSGLGFYVTVSSNEASGAATKVDWKLFVNKDATAFGTALEQTLVACTSAALDTKNEVLTLTPDATAAAAFTAGAWVTLELFNASTNDDDLEIKGVSRFQTETQ